jgi:hypothetical protein
VAHLIILVADHRAKVTFVCQLHGFYAASTTPRNTALSPGQSPPLVRTPIRVFIFAIAGSEHFFWICQTTGSGPLVV